MSGSTPENIASWHIEHHNECYDIHWCGWYDDDGVQIYHNESGPAQIIKYANIRPNSGEIAAEGYCINGQLHRLDGPAVINYDIRPQNEYYILGISVSERDFNTPGFIDAFILEHS